MFKLLSKRSLLLVLALISLGGCVAPTQYQGEIPIDTEGFARRTATLCRLNMLAGPACDASRPHP